MKLEELNMHTESMYWSSFFTHYGLKEGAKIEIAYDIQAQNTSVCSFLRKLKRQSFTHTNVLLAFDTGPIHEKQCFCGAFEGCAV